MAKTLIIPGLDGSPEPHWQHWWAATDPKALTVHQDSWADPTPESWEVELAGAVIQHPGAVLVAHSLGCIVVAQLLAKWPQLRISAALLVAPADPGKSERLRAFANVSRNRFDVPVTVVASRNDPWMSFSKARGLAADWGADLVDMGFAGHINVASGFGPWPGGLRLRDDLIARAKPSGLREMNGSRALPVASRWAF